MSLVRDFANRPHYNKYPPDVGGWTGQGTGGFHAVFQNNYYGQSIWSQVGNCYDYNNGMYGGGYGYGYGCGYNYGGNCNGFWRSTFGSFAYGLGMGTVNGLLQGISYGINSILQNKFAQSEEDA